MAVAIVITLDPAFHVILIVEAAGHGEVAAAIGELDREAAIAGDRLGRCEDLEDIIAAALEEHGADRVRRDGKIAAVLGLTDEEAGLDVTFDAVHIDVAVSACGGERARYEHRPQSTHPTHSTSSFRTPAFVAAVMPDGPPVLQSHSANEKARRSRDLRASVRVRSDG